MQDDQYSLFGGEPPSQAHSPTSVAAAAAIKPKIGRKHEQILGMLRFAFAEDGGFTDEEMQRGIPMGANTQRPRRRELQLWGYIVDSGKTRMTSSGREAVVWEIAR